jgi:hypothetical protein
MTSGARSLIFALLAFPAWGQAWDLPALMTEMARVEESRARFVETRHIALLTRPLELKGSLSYERPHRLAKHVLSPVDELLTVDRETLTVVNRTTGEQRLISLREQPAAGALVASVRATLAGDLAELERHYRAELSGARSAWRLRLEPRNPQVKRAVESVVLAGAGARIGRIEALEASGDRSVMTILHDAK